MKKIVEFENVVSIKSTVIKTYPMWSDYGCLTNAVTVIYKNKNGEYVQECYQTESMDGEDYYEVKVLSRISDGGAEYRDIIRKSRIGSSARIALKGDVIEVVKGRKFPKGTRFTVKDERTWKDIYGRIQAYYWLTEEGEMVNQSNCVIVEARG